MAAFKIDEQICAPIEEVFAFATDMQRLADWNPSIVSCHVVDDRPLGEGVRLLERRTRGNANSVTETLIEVVDYEPPFRYSARAQAAGLEVTYHFLYQTVRDHTQVDFYAEFKGRWWARPLIPIFEKLMEDEDGDALQRLKAAVESRDKPIS